MKLFGLEIRKAAGDNARLVDDRASMRGNVFGIIRESFAGAFQRDVDLTPEVVLSYSAVYACITLIAQDVGKLRVKLMQKGDNGIWKETTSPAFSPVLTKPNRFQNHIQFKEWWITSKLTHGNTYVLKERDRRGIVVALYVLDSTPGVVKVLVAPDGSVFYEIPVDNLSGIEGPVRVPASEIIHDRMNCLFHPLVGTSPIFACGAAASAGIRIQRGATRFFGKGAMPSGVLSAPDLISQETAARLKEHWETMFTGDHAGAVAVLGEGLKWEPMRMTAVDAQLIEQLKWSAETVCSTFHVPPFKIGIGVMPTYSNAAESLNQIYYSDCLQSLIEVLELLLDEGLGLDAPKDGKIMGTELDLTSLIRMDTGAQIKSLTDGIAGALYTVNEARAQVDLEPLTGGDTVHIQQQNFSLEALAKRDAREDPFASAAKAQDSLPPAPDPKLLAPPAKSADDVDLIAIHLVAGILPKLAVSAQRPALPFKPKERAA